MINCCPRETSGKFHLSLTKPQPIDEKEIFLMTRAVQNHPEVPPRHTVRAKSRIIPTLALSGALGLTGCIDSAAPILTGAQPVFGPHLRVHAYSIINGQASGPEIGAFQWERGQYRSVRSEEHTSELQSQSNLVCR